MRYSNREVDRFWAKVKLPETVGTDECWEWNAAKSKRYGVIRIKGRSVKASRFAYEVSISEIPDGLDVCHSCDNPGCCNPAHLWLGTAKDNGQDMAAKGRQFYQRHPERIIRGVCKPNAKASDDIVREIRQRYALGKISQKQLADEYGIGQVTIWRIVNRVSWKHVSD